MAYGNGHVLYSGMLTTTAPVPVWTMTSGTVTICHGTICNTSALAVTVSMSVLPPGATVDGTHVAISNYSLAAGDTLSLKDYLDGATLGYGDSIWVTAATANSVVVVLSGLLS